MKSLIRKSYANSSMVNIMGALFTWIFVKKTVQILIDTCDTYSNLPVSILTLCSFTQKQTNNILCGTPGDKNLVTDTDTSS